MTRLPGCTEGGRAGESHRESGGGGGGGQLRPVKPWGVGQVIELSRKPLNTLFHPTASEQMAMWPKVPPPSPSPAYCVPGSRTPTKVPRGHGVQAESRQDVLCALQTRAPAHVAERVTAATHPGLLWGSRWEHQQVSEQREDRDRRPGPALRPAPRRPAGRSPRTAPGHSPTRAP